MSRLTDAEKKELRTLIEADLPLPAAYRAKLFAREPSAAPQTPKEYRLEYAGKMRREEVLAETPAAPWQLEREFCTERPHADGWRNLLVWGDNLLAMRGLLADQQGPNRFGTRGRIKLIYIDPPFATRQDFMKDKEKAYRDKVLGAQFIEFLRRRLILLRELLADDGSIYVHLDWKKGHYMKAVLDEVFGEENFRNEIIWDYSYRMMSLPSFFNRKHDSIFFYAKSDAAYFKMPRSAWTLEALLKSRKQAIHVDEHGEEWIWMPGAKGNSKSRLKRVAEILEDGKAISDVWDLGIFSSSSSERENYPTQKPENLIERIIQTSCPPDGIVLDCFAGSGTTAAVAEKLGRRWIAMDCGKLAIYTMGKRLVSLTSIVGTAKNDHSVESARVKDWAEHLKNAPGVLLITEKARKGECEVTLELLHDLAALVKKHGIVTAGTALSLVCPEDKLRVPADQLAEPEDAPGEKSVRVGGVEFRLSLIAPRARPEKEQPLPARAFSLYRAGLYDMAAIRDLPWADYRPFVLKLFGVREHSHARYGFNLDGYIGTHSALVWNFPDHRTLTLDYGFVADLHRTVRGKPGERFFVIAPVVTMDFAEDEVARDGATYVFLKVPLSVLLRLIERREPAAFKQPSKEADVNEVIDAAGFDFISQPKVGWQAKKTNRKGEMFADFVLEISEFRAQTLATDPEDFRNFETFSMAMMDVDYNGTVFRLSRVFWGEDVIAAAGGLEQAGRLELRVPEQDFTGERMMVILCDRYGNEKSLLLEKGDFETKPRRTAQLTAKNGRKSK